MHDVLRVEDSTLERKDSPILEQIDKAHEQLRSSTVDKVEVALLGPVAATSTETLRATLREIRFAVNDFRDRRFESLVRDRAMLDRVSTLLGFVAWAVLALSIVFDAPAEAVVSVAAFYLIGVAAGLSTQLRGSSPSASHEDIFGYGQAHLRQTMLMSGLAAVVGIVLAWIASQGGPEGLTLEGLTAALKATPASLLTAALCGLVPGALLDRMSEWAKTNLDDLDSTLGGQKAGSG